MYCIRKISTELIDIYMLIHQMIGTNSYLIWQRLRNSCYCSRAKLDCLKGIMQKEETLHAAIQVICAFLTFILRHHFPTKKISSFPVQLYPVINLPRFAKSEVNCVPLLGQPKDQEGKKQTFLLSMGYTAIQCVVFIFQKFSLNPWVVPTWTNMIFQ